ncbi:alkaline phosphatase family protein [Cerasicoccus fimbriatus]|uniref:alkaline phosphatase family protein n=1 Tax=Cerasicoccus fimbriatus TaxID=3014554 RepID=UPI0022B30864|nr:alkaline phosphatase family protein [Cerasicoccus sp. TK19100]
MKPRVDVFIFADALGWKIAEERDFMRELFPVRNPCQTLFGYSSTCDPTILTGALPCDHGHFSFFVKAEGESPFRDLGKLGFLPQKLAGHHRVRNRVSRYFATKLGYTGYFQLYSVPFGRLPYLDYTEKKDIYEPGGIIGGQRTIFEHWQESGKAWIRSDWRAGDAANIAQAKDALAKGDIELMYLFTAGLDATMHKYGPTGPGVDAAFDQFANALRELHATAAKSYREVRLHLFSDHGMAKVTTASDMLRRWSEVDLLYGVDYVAVWDSTMVRFWFLNDHARKVTTAWLQAQPDGKIVTDAELEAGGCLFPNRRYGELFYLLPAGSLFVPSFMNMGFVTGMHGYDPAHPDSTACWLATHETLPVAQLTDIFPVMREAANSTHVCE